MTSMVSVKEASELIGAGKKLLLAGDEQLLAALPKGDWIGGTISYFMSEEGGVCTHERLQATVLPECALKVQAKLYATEELQGIPQDYAANGFAFAIFPAFTEVLAQFAKNCSTWSGVFDRPLVGWVAGNDQNNQNAPKVFNGQTGEQSDAMAAVLQVELEDSFYARANIINLFQLGDGDTLTFPKRGFEVTECFVNGEPRIFTEYLKETGADLQRPMAANYCGALINVGMRKVDEAAGTVQLFAPVFPRVKYKMTVPLDDYEAEFDRRVPNDAAKPVFSCNCILNYLYAHLEGKKTGNLVGPISFGEIAYMLLNQTVVYLTVEKK